MRLYDIESKFTTMEFACPCGCGFGLQEADIDRRLIDRLNIMRILLGRGITINSGARCAKYNASVGGEPLSAHLPHPVSGQCRAADLRIKTSQERFLLGDLAYRIGFRRLGAGEALLHVDVAWDLPDAVLWTY